MRLSEAIRLGSMLRPQGFGDFFVDGGSCAWGAAIEAVGYLLIHEQGDFLTLLPPQFNDAIHQTMLGSHFNGSAKCPSCGLMIGGIIPHLNDIHRWTREAIADYVELREIEFGLWEPFPTVIETSSASEAPAVSHAHD